jgi:hypothetical protein
MNLPARFDAPEHPVIEACDEGVLNAAGDSQGDLALTKATCQRGDGLGQRQIRHEKVVPPLHCLVELVAAGL